jgi:hypothetical protein
MSTVAKKLLQAKTESAEIVGYQYVGIFGTGTLNVSDVSDINNITAVDSLSDGALTIVFPHGSAFDRDRSLLFVGDPIGDEIVCIDLSDPANLVSRDTITSSTRLNFVQGISASTDRQLIFAGCGTSTSPSKSLSAIDYSDPDNLAFSGNPFNVGYLYKGCACTEDGNTFFVSEGDDLIAIDSTNTSSMSELDHYHLSLAGQLKTIRIDEANDVMYGIGHSDSSFLSYDISNPSSLSYRDVITDNTNLDEVDVLQIDLTNNYAFVMTQLGKLSSFDISDPDNLVRKDTLFDSDFDTNSSYRSIALDIERKLIFCVSRSNGRKLAIVSYDDVENLTKLTTHTFTSGNNGGGIVLFN